MPTLVHFDISADDPARAKVFYEKLFDWKIQSLPGPQSYYLIETKDLKGENALGGGLSKRDKNRQAGINNFIGVTSVDESLKKVVQLGGKIIQPKQTVPGWGFLALCADTENNIFGLFQEETNAK